MPSKSFAHVTLLNDSDLDGSTDHMYTGSPSLVADGFWKCPSEERKQSNHLSMKDGARDSNDDVSTKHRNLVSFYLTANLIHLMWCGNLSEAVIMLAVMIIL